MLTVYYLFLHKETEYSIMVPVVSLGTVLVNILLKSYFSRPRPLDPLLQNIQGFSFPSGHSMSAFTFYGLLIYIAWNKINNISLKWTTIAALAFVILMIGFSRIYFRAHYATDVLAGFTIGAIWLILSIAVMRKIISFSPNQNPFTD